MAFLGKGNKKDLQEVATELGVEGTQHLKLYELRDAILASKNYDEEFVKETLANVLEARKRKEEMEERIRREEIEERKRKEEMEERIRREEIEERKRKEEMEERLRREEIELEKMRLENARIELEKKGIINETSEKTRVKLHNILQKFDPKTCEISLYLVLFERQAKRAEIKRDDWVSHLIGLLPYEIAEVIAREDEEITNDYGKVKELLLKRYKLTPERFRQLFNKHTKKADITWRDFAYELKNYFTEWIRGLEVNTFEELYDLIITDQIKRKVPPEIKEHFIDEWSLFKSSDIISSKLDDYENVKMTFNKKPREISHKENWNLPSKGANFGNNNRDEKRVFTKPQQEQRDIRPKFSCYLCGKEGHMKKSCPKLNSASTSYVKTNKKSQESKGLNKVSVNLNSACFEWEFPVNEKDGELLKVDLGIGGQKFQGIVDSGAEITVLRKSVVPEEHLQSSGKILLRPAIGNPVEAQLVSVPLSLHTDEEIIPYVQVHAAVVEGLHEEALITPRVYEWLKEQKRSYLGDDTGITSVKEANEQSLFSVEGRSPENISLGDKVNIPKKEVDEQSLFHVKGRNPGNSGVEVNITPVEENNEPSLFKVEGRSPGNYSSEEEVEVITINEVGEQSLFSVPENNSNDNYLGDEAISTPLTEDNEKCMFCMEGESHETIRKAKLNNSESHHPETKVFNNSVVKQTLTETDSKDERNENIPVPQAQVFRDEQLACPTLKRCFEEARQHKNGYWIERGLLYHMGKVGGQKYIQLVVPASRRKDILKLAHETPTGGHLAAKKTRDRIAMSFWWEGMPKEVKQLCASCHDCQMRRKGKVNDRTPIEAVGRPELPFQVVNADILGPIEPKSSRGHQYVLCVMDQHSRWPEAIPLKSLTAKAACDAFIEIFVRTGIPRVIAMDNGRNFAAQLTKEFLKRLGCVPKFSTPGYPQSNGLVERWIGTMKSMLHHAINSQGRGWDKQLPFLLWAYREVPNATTGVAPFLLVHGRPPVGPLAILKSSWEDEVVLPQGIGESVADYLLKLRKRLEDAAQYANSIAQEQQQKYVHYHNLRSKDTEFSVGDEVVVLIPDSTNRLCSKWKGPGEIVEKKSPHSFYVKLPDGSVRHLHQNKLRKYIQPVRAVGIIYETDEEFGDIQHAPVESRQVTDEELKADIKSNSISAKQHKQLLNLIKEYLTIFDGELKKAKVPPHVIQLKSGVERKQPHLYKVPETLRSNIEKQIAELLEKDLIEPSSAEIAYPLVCVAKKDGTVRLCVDYRELNSVSKIPPFPMQNSENLRFKAGGARYLTTLDILKGYWEIPLAEQSRELTSFVSPKGQYQWKVMPFGLSGAPATFQRIMNQVLRPHSDYAESFLDDIIIFSSNWEDHLNHIKSILETLKKLNFSANLKKCSFAMSKVKYLGHVVGSGEHGPDPDKISVIKDLKAPKTKKTLKSLLGLFNYYRDYVPRYANIAKPLTDLTRKTVPNDLPWSEEAESAFNSLKNCLCSITSLYTPDMSKPFEIDTDASVTGIGACLMQRDEQNKLKPITFASQKLTPAQSKWSTIEREAYAVIWALGKFEMWTYGTTIILHTDHNPLKYLTETVPKNARLQRWALALSRYQVTIAHKPGSSNTIADALSRIHE